MNKYIYHFVYFENETTPFCKGVNITSVSVVEAIKTFTNQYPNAIFKACMLTATENTKLTITQDELDELLTILNNTPLKGQRKGQAFFNLLYKFYPSVANSIRNTEYDPFYQDELLDKCINKILKTTN